VGTEVTAQTTDFTD